MKTRCEGISALVIGAILYTGCLLPAEAQNPQCPNRPGGDSTNACANTRFVASATASIPVSIVTYGAICDGNSANATVNNAAFVAALASATVVSVQIPAGDCRVSNTIAMTSYKSIVGLGKDISTITQTTAATPVITIGDSSVSPRIQGMTITRVPAATLGGNGVIQAGSVSNGTIDDVLIRNQYDGVLLGNCGYCRMSRFNTVYNINDGIRIGIPTFVGDQGGQWQLIDGETGSNGGNGIAALCSAPMTRLTLGNWAQISTYANLKSAIRVVGTATCSVNAIRLTGGFFGNDGATGNVATVYIDSYQRDGIMHSFTDVMMEAGLGHGYEITANNDAVTITNPWIDSMYSSGIISSAIKTIVTGGTILNNGVGALGGSSSSGVYSLAGALQITNTALGNRGSFPDTQQYGVFLNAASVGNIVNNVDTTYGTGNTIAGVQNNTATSAILSGVSLTGSAGTQVAGLPGKTFAFNNTFGVGGVDGAVLDFTNGGTISYIGKVETFTGVKTFGSAGAVGKLAIAGTTSGSTILNASAVASGTLTLPAATDTLVGRDTTDTLTLKTLTAPKFANGGFIADANGNELLTFITTATAVNEITLANAATGTWPIISVTGGDSNVGFRFQTKGTGFFGISPSTIAADSLLTVNANTAAAVAPSNVATLHLIGADATEGGISLDTYAAVPRIMTRRAGGTQAAKTAVVSTDVLGSIAARGWSGSAYSAAGNFQFVAAENWSGTAFGTDWLLFTTPKTTAAQVEAIRASASGGFSVGTSSDPGTGMIYTNAATFMIRTKTSYTNGAGASAATIANAPAVGNPTKWIPVDDNGTTRYIPAW